MPQTTPTQQKVLNRLMELVENNELTNADIVQIIELLGGYLNLQTIAAYAEKNGKSYNGVKKHRQIINLFGCKLVLDNE